MKTAFLVSLLFLSACSVTDFGGSAETDEPIVEPLFAHFMVDEAIKLIARIDSRQVTLYQMRDSAPPLQSLLEDKMRIQGFSISRSEGNLVECALIGLGDQRYLLTLAIGQEKATRLFRTEANSMIPESGWSFQGASRYE